MFIAAIRANGYRNLEGRIPICQPLSVLIGENNTGKSNLIEAMRVLFEPAAGPPARRWITKRDFAHDGAGNLLVDTLELEAELRELTESELAQMVTCLAPSIGPDAAKLRLRAKLRSDDRVDVEWFGGDSEHPDIERWAREAVRHTYLHPLRDAGADLRPGRENRLVALLRALAPDGHTDRDQIVKIVTDANALLGDVEALKTAKQGIENRVRDMVGGGPFAQRTDLAFAEARFDRIVSSLRALAGAIEPLELAENGLGYNNILYMAVLLAALSSDVNSGFHLLLVEEPEAHLHPQLQDLLMRYLESASGDGTQVVVTSHSPNFASSARVERTTVMVLSRADVPEREHAEAIEGSAGAVADDVEAGPRVVAIARAPVDFGLNDKQLGHLRRFLDVTKAALLFARGVILVEGVAEQLLVPEFATRIGRPLARHGVAVINIGGVAFEPFIELFAPDRLPYRCAVLSDSDAQTAPAEEQGGPSPGRFAGDLGEDGSGEASRASTTLSPRAAALLAREADNIRVRLSQRTFEWDLVVAGNWEMMLDALGELKPVVAGKLRGAGDLSPVDRADELLSKVTDVKGQFAQELADRLEADREADFLIPAYLQEAIQWVTGD